MQGGTSHWAEVEGSNASSWASPGAVEQGTVIAVVAPSPADRLPIQ